MVMNNHRLFLLEGRNHGARETAFRRGKRGSLGDIKENYLSVVSAGKDPGPSDLAAVEFPLIGSRTIDA